MSNKVPALVESITREIPKGIFKSPEEQKSFARNMMAVYLNNSALQNLDPKKVGACALQLYLKGADMTNGEGFIIGYKSGKTGETVATVQTGYKYAINKLYKTGELKSMPVVVAVKKGEIQNYNPHTQEATINPIVIDSNEEFTRYSKLPVEGYLVTFEMANADNIVKFYWRSEIVEHIKKYSESYNRSKGKGIWETNGEDMIKKTALMRTYTKYLPKTPKISAAIQDIKTLNFTTFDEMSSTAKATYVDNPDGSAAVRLQEQKMAEAKAKAEQAAAEKKAKLESAKVEVQPKVQAKPVEKPVVEVKPKETSENAGIKKDTFYYLSKEEKLKAWTAECLSTLSTNMEKTQIINNLVVKLAKDGKISNPSADRVNVLTAKDYLEVVVPVIEKFKTLGDLQDFIEGRVKPAVEVKETVEVPAKSEEELYMETMFSDDDEQEETHGVDEEEEVEDEENLEELFRDL